MDLIFSLFDVAWAQHVPCAVLHEVQVCLFQVACPWHHACVASPLEEIPELGGIIEYT